MNLKDYQENRFKRGIYDRRNKINDLTGKEWLFSTRTVKTKDYESKFNYTSAMEKGFFESLPIELVTELLSTFSKSNSLIIDPFCNFGSSALAAHISLNNCIYNGFNLISSNIIDLSFLKTTKTIKIYTKNFDETAQLQSNLNSNVIFSELIFHSYNLVDRVTQFKKWLKSLEEFLKLIINEKFTNFYLILCLQNSKTENTYNNHIYQLFNSIKSFNIILKGEMIWQIPDPVFEEMKSYLENRIKMNSSTCIPLNEKRILVFRMEP